MLSPAAGGSIAALSEKGFAATRVCRAVCVAFGVALFGVPERAKCCPFFKYGENSAVGETVPSVAPVRVQPSGVSFS